MKRKTTIACAGLLLAILLAVSGLADQPVGTVSIPQGVTVIETEAFFNCAGITEVVLPDSVTAIGDRAFDGCAGLREITLSAQVSAIGQDAFARCGEGFVIRGVSGSPAETYAQANGIRFLPLGEDTSGEGSDGLIFTALTEGGYAVSGYQGTDAQVIIPSSYEGQAVTRINSDAFKNNTGVTSVFLPESIAEVEDHLFYCCANLTDIQVSDRNPAFVSVDGVLYSRDRKVIWAYPEGKTDASYAVPDTVERIGRGAFRNSKLQSVTLPASVTTVDGYAFCQCSDLQELTLSEGLRYIGFDAFSFCRKLTSVTLPESLKTLDSYAFESDTQLGNITIPAGLTSIGHSVFAGNAMTAITVAEGNHFYTAIDGVLFDKDVTLLLAYPSKKQGWYTVPSTVREIGNNAFAESAALSGVTLPEGLQRIGIYAFSGCSSLTSVHIPASVTAMDPTGLFVFCPNLTSITVSPDHPNYTSIDGVLFNKDCTEICIFPNGMRGDYTVPETITHIVSLSFNTCRYLQSVTFPATVTRIDQAAIFNSSGIKKVTILGQDTVIANNAFTQCVALTTLCGPAGGAAEQYANSNGLTFEAQ